MVNEWTRKDLPDFGAMGSVMARWKVSYGAVSGVLDAVVAHLNANGGLPADDRWRRAHEIVEHERDQAREQWKKSEHKANEWRERAEKAKQLIPAYAMLDVWSALGRDSIHFDDWYDDLGYADAWAELTATVREERGDLDAARENAEHYQAMFDATERQRDEWKSRAEAAEARTAPTVSREDVEKAIRDNEHRVNDDGFLHHEVNITEAADAVCALFGVEAEPADPVERKAAELYEAGLPVDIEDVARWDNLAPGGKDMYRRIAAHVLGQEAKR